MGNTSKSKLSNWLRSFIDQITTLTKITSKESDIYNESYTTSKEHNVLVGISKKEFSHYDLEDQQVHINNNKEKNEGKMTLNNIPLESKDQEEEEMKEEIKRDDS